MNVMNSKIKAAWRKMTGTALLWVSLATLVYIPSADMGGVTIIIAIFGFISFAFGLSLFADGVKYDLLEQLRSQPS